MYLIFYFLPKIGDEKGDQSGLKAEFKDVEKYLKMRV